MIKKVLLRCIFIACGIGVFGLTHAAEQLSAYEIHIYSRLLLSEDVRLVKLGAKSMEYNGYVDPALSDVVAKLLWEFNEERRSLSLDCAAWLIKAIGATRSNRYRPVLESIAKKYPGKLDKYATLVTPQLVGSEISFEPGAVDLHILADAVENQAPRNSVTAEPLPYLPPGTSLEDIAAKLGFPSFVSGADHTKHGGFGTHYSFDNLLLVFAERGAIELDHRGGHWKSVSVFPWPLSLGSMPDLAEKHILRGLLNPNPINFQLAARRAYESGTKDSATLDVAAWRLRQDINSADGHVRDGLAYLCLLFGQARDLQYRNLLQEVVSKAAPGKVRRHAEDALKNISKH